MFKKITIVVLIAVCCLCSVFSVGADEVPTETVTEFFTEVSTEISTEIPSDSATEKITDPIELVTGNPELGEISKTLDYQYSIILVVVWLLAFVLCNSLMK